MKKIITLFLTSIALTSCQEDLKFSNPGFQALKDDVLWKSNDARAYISETGKLTIDAYTEYEKVTLKTSSTDIGTYVLGSTDTNNFASFSSDLDNLVAEYETIPVTGPVYSVSLYSAGSGYTSDCDLQSNNEYVCDYSHETTGGSGSGLKVSIVTNNTGNVLKVVRIASRGNGYVPGDIVTVTEGNLNCKLKVVNVQNSNGEIQITNFDNEKMTITGKFKFNAVQVGDNPLLGSTVNFQYGEFYNVPIYPNP